MMIGRELEVFVQDLFANGQFSLRLQDRIMQEVEKELASRASQVSQKKPESIVKVTSLVEDIGDTMQQLVDIGLRQSLSTQFVTLTDQALQLRSELEELRMEFNSEASNQRQEIDALRKLIEDVRRRSEARVGVSRIQQSLKSKLSSSTIVQRSSPSIAPKQEHSFATQIKELQEQLHGSQQQHMKHQEDLSVSLKTKLEQIHQKLKKDIIGLGTRCDSLAADRELFNSERLEKAVKKQVDSRFQSLGETVEEHRRFFVCYQEQFTDFERSVKKYLECSIETIWKVITEIRFQLEEMPYRHEELPEESQKKPSSASPFGFLFG